VVLILPPCVLSFHRPGLASVILADGQAGWVALGRPRQNVASDSDG
jgi:hypothetical protein